jgi:anti-sigma regulatory factor (Ser/Thr protein kinase)
LKGVKSKVLLTAIIVFAAAGALVCYLFYGALVSEKAAAEKNARSSAALFASEYNAALAALDPEFISVSDLKTSGAGGGLVSADEFDAIFASLGAKLGAGGGGTVWSAPIIKDGGVYRFVLSGGGGGAALVRINPLITLAREFVPEASGFAALLDTGADFILFNGDQFGGARAGGRASAIIWYRTVVLKGAESLNIYGQPYIAISVTLADGLTFISGIPANELFKESYNRFFLCILTVSVSFAVLLCALAVILRVTLRKAEGRILRERLSDFELLSVAASPSVAPNRAVSPPALNAAANGNPLLGGSAETDSTSDAPRLNAADDAMAANEIMSGVIQSGFPEFTVFDEFKTAAKLYSADTACGDFYDLFMNGEDKLCIVAGDVYGEGTAAMLYTANVKNTIRNYVTISGKLTLAEIADKLNAVFCRDSHGGFAHVFIGCLDIGTGEFAYVNAGYPMPLLAPRIGDVRALGGEPDFVLGALEDADYSDKSVTLEPGDRLFFASNGVTDARGKSGEMFGKKRLSDVLFGCKMQKPDALIVSVHDEATAFLGGAEQEDDMSFIAVEYAGALEFERELTVPALREQLLEVLEFIDSPLKKSAFSEKTVMQLSLAAEEVFINIASYAYNSSKKAPTEWETPDKNGATINRRGYVTVRTCVADDPLKFVLRFEDNGSAYNPLAAVPSNVLRLENEGGLGLVMVKNIMDGMRYERRKGKNILTLSKFNEP